jgi:DNA-binding transcriptional regulator YhcF (GntR family)
MSRPGSCARVLLAIRDHWEREGYAPTVRELADACAMSVGGVQAVLAHLSEIGAVTHKEGCPRTVRVTRDEDLLQRTIGREGGTI